MSSSDSDLKRHETFYEVLKVDQQATVAEIVSAYHLAKNAFSKDSIATYSLFNPEEVQEVLAKLEEAYLTLSSLEKRADYDKRLYHSSEEGFMQSENIPLHASIPVAPPSTPSTVRPVSNEPPIEMTAEGMKGSFFKEVRERRGLSVEDVARITKIPLKFLHAIESDDLKKMPARVYIQGFVKNLAALYKLDTTSAVKTYLAYLDKLTAPTL